jgi:hypothetical protein
MRVHCEIEETELEGDYGPVDGVVAICSRCSHTTESLEPLKQPTAVSRTDARGMPEGENNFYVAD